MGKDTVKDVRITRDAGETAGTYAIRVTGGKVVSADGLDVSGDYNLTYASGTLTIKGSTTPSKPSTPTPAAPTRPITYDPVYVPTAQPWPAWTYPVYDYYDPYYYDPYYYGRRTYYDDTSTDDSAQVMSGPSIAEGSRPKATRTTDAAGTATTAPADGVVSSPTDASTSTTPTDTSVTTTTTSSRPSASRALGSVDETPVTRTATNAVEPKDTASDKRPSATRSEDGTATETETNTAKVTSGKVVRHAGTTRYDTMASAIEAAFGHSDWVVVASGEDHADALSAVALAGAHDAPVVLTAKGFLSSQAEQQIRRLGATHAVIVGGRVAVSDGVAAALEGIVGDVTRVSGADRAGTSVAALKAVRAAKGTADTVIVVSGASFADALSAGPWAWRKAAPIVLTDSRGMLTDEAVEAIKSDGGFKLVLVVGGESAVSSTIQDQLGDSFTYAREGGSDRYDTSLLMAGFAATNGLGWSSPVVVTGTGFADALSGAALAGKLGSPLLLVGADGGRAASEVGRHAETVEQVHVLGGTSAVPASVEEQLDTTLA